MRLSKKDTPDFWEQLDTTTFYRPLAAKTIDQFLSGEFDNATISSDLGRWWLKIDGVLGEAPYDDLVTAKAAGDIIVEKYENATTGWILTSLGLSADEWKLEIVDGMPVISSLESEEITLSAGETSPRWSLLQGNDFIFETDDVRDALARANDLILASAPKP